MAGRGRWGTQLEVFVGVVTPDRKLTQHQQKNTNPTFKRRSSKLLNLVWDCYFVIWVVIGLITTPKTNNKKSASVSFFGGSVIVFPLGKVRPPNSAEQCEVNRNCRIDLDVDFQNSFAMGELN